MRRAALALLAISRAAAAEPEAPLAALRDDKALADTLAAIAADPTIHAPDPKARKAAQALMREGVVQVRAARYDEGLAIFLDAYARFPSPRILMNIASTLYDMRRFADAANTYQRYLFDPIAQRERLAEVKDLLTRLDASLTILTIRVYPQDAQISIDSGPFITVAHSLQTRVRPGTHTVRIRKDTAANEVTLNGFEGENKEVIAALPGAAIDEAPIDPGQLQYEWLKVGRGYSVPDATGESNVRHVNAGFGGPVLTARVPELDETDVAMLTALPPEEEPITSGALGLMRIDGKGRGVAAGIGIAIARDRFEGELLLLRSQETGAYLGGRYRFLTGQLRPYAALGIPMFVFDAVDLDATASTTHLGIGVRAAAGLEVVVNGHISVQADLGYEHFWRVSMTNFEADVFVPTLGVIGRL